VDDCEHQWWLVYVITTITAHTVWRCFLCTEEMTVFSEDKDAGDYKPPFHYEIHTSKEFIQ